MKHTTEELIFADLIRKRVRSLQLAKTEDMTPEEEDAFKKLPVNDLIEEALDELDRIAGVIKHYRSKTVDTPPSEAPKA